MTRLRFHLLSFFILGASACGGGGGDSTSAASSGSGAGGGGPSGSGGGSSSSGGDGGSGGSAPSACEPFGHFGIPENTFTLPPASGSGGIYYTDIQQSFDKVDWATLDRLYIPAGKYKFIQIGNLPDRDPKRPLIITNLGGQVQVGPNDPGAGYIWSMNGGSNWTLTGRYDPDSKTGDAGFPGHRCGGYEGSRGKYGFFSDDAFAKGQYLHMGIAVGDASSFELEYLEIFRSGFAGIRILNKLEQGDPLAPMEDVRIHDNYVHDVDGEGFYFGWTGFPPSNLSRARFRVQRARSGRDGPRRDLLQERELRVAHSVQRQHLGRLAQAHQWAVRAERDERIGDGEGQRERPRGRY